MEKNLLFALALLTACSGIETIEDNPPQQKTYTITLDVATRALSLEGKTLNASWATTENVYVQKGGTWAGGSLKPDADATAATLKGELSGITIEAGDNLTLQFPRSGEITYSGQKGTLADIAQNFDWATASVTVKSVSPSGEITPEAASAVFTNRQAIVKFTLRDKADGTTLLSPDAFTVNDGTADVVSLTGIPASTYTANGIGALFIAMPAVTGKTVTLTASVGSESYTYTTPSSVSFAAGKYYEIGVMMKKSIDLSSLASSYTAQNGDVLTGTLTGNYKISIADGATVRLQNVVIDGAEGALSTRKWAGITSLGDATIIIGGTNSVNSFHDDYPGIFVPEGKTLTFLGDGSLTVNPDGRGYAAGIGSGNATNTEAGNIRIEGGNITTTGGSGGAGIGAAGDYSCGTIYICGGCVTATGGYQAAGIGGGSSAGAGDITITDGVSSVTATKGPYAQHSIGLGASGILRTVTIGGNTGAVETSPYTYPES